MMTALPRRVLARETHLRRLVELGRELHPAGGIGHVLTFLAQDGLVEDFDRVLIRRRRRRKERRCRVADFAEIDVGERARPEAAHDVICADTGRLRMDSPGWRLAPCGRATHTR